jgi:hypothetical protein
MGNREDDINTSTFYRSGYHTIGRRMGCWAHCSTTRCLAVPDGSPALNVISQGRSFANCSWEGLMEDLLAKRCQARSEPHVPSLCRAVQHEHLADQKSLLPDAGLLAVRQQTADFISRLTPLLRSQRYQQDKNLAELIGGVARTYATAPQYAELAEGIAVQPNILKAVTAANVATTDCVALWLLQLIRRSPSI